MADLSEADSQLLIQKVTAWVKVYMSSYDGSHDFSHIQRVLALSHHLASCSCSSPPSTPAYDPLTITLSALLHDVGDKKYLTADQDPQTQIQTLLLSLSAPAALASKIQTIALAVSYSSEVRDPSAVTAVLARYPELAVVQDADRLDAIGAVGVGRAFTFGGARGGGGGGGGRGMAGTMEHFDEKLLLLEGRMKTERGREMARERTERLRVFKGWWEEEQGIVGRGTDLNGV